MIAEQVGAIAGGIDVGVLGLHGRVVYRLAGCQYFSRVIEREIELNLLCAGRIVSRAQFDVTQQSAVLELVFGASFAESARITIFLDAYQSAAPEGRRIS